MRIAALPQFLKEQMEVLSVPGPISLSPFTFGREMSADALSYMQRLMEDYGDIVRFPFPLRPIFQVTDPDLIGKLLLGTGKTNMKSIGYRRIKPLLGEGLVTSEGALWRQQRKLANPAFQQKMINSFFALIQQETLQLAAEWQERIGRDSTLDLSRDMAKLTFTIIVKTLFSMDLSQKADRIKEAMQTLQNYAAYLFYSVVPIPMAIPTPSNLKIRRAMETINSIVYEIIEEHRQNPDRYHDLLSVFMQTRDEDGQGMSDQLLRDEVVTLMLAGHETTAFSLGIAFDLIARHAEVRQKIDTELSALPENTLGIEDLKQLPYTAQVFAETLRLYPATWSIGRELTESMSYKNFYFPKGSTMILVQYLTHRNPRYWDQPLEFRPERFQADSSTYRHPFAYFPFGGGPRSCIGSNLAKLEAQVILTTLLRRFKMEAIVGHSYRMHPRISMTLDPGVKLKVSLRS